MLSFLLPGIPDFRSPGTGLYSRLQKYNLCVGLGELGWLDRSVHAAQRWKRRDCSCCCRRRHMGDGAGRR